MSQVTWNSINQIAQWTAKLWSVLRACTGQILTLGWLKPPNPVPAGDGISTSPGLWQKSPLSCSCVCVEIKQLSQGNARVKKSSKNSFAFQLPTAHQGSKRDLGVTEWKQSPTTTIFHITVRFLKRCGRKAVGEGRGERNWILYFLLAEEGGRHKICVTL